MCVNHLASKDTVISLELYVNPWSSLTNIKGRYSIVSTVSRVIFYFNNALYIIVSKNLKQGVPNNYVSPTSEDNKPATLVFLSVISLPFTSLSSLTWLLHSFFHP